MSKLDYNILYDNLELLEMFPLGLLSDNDNPGEKRAFEAIQTIEELIDSGSKQNYLLSRYSLLQIFPRMVSEHVHELNGDSELNIVDNFIRQYTISLTPEWYDQFIESLDDTEIEVFFKNYLIAHETWGREDGMKELIRTMMECVLHVKVPVNVFRLEKQKRRIPENVRSRLGKNNSTLGSDLLMGRKFFGRPDSYEISIGPISHNELKILQKRGWAEDKEPSKKLKKLASYAEPYFMNSNIRILLAMRGFKVGKAILGKSNLGEVIDD